MRTADLALRHGIQPELKLRQEMGDRPAEAFAELFTGLIPMAKIIQADNVADYVKKRPHDYTLDSFPALTPPWPAIWLEYPGMGGTGQRRGVMVLDVTDMDIPWLERMVEKARSDCEDPSKIRWVTSWTLFIEHKKRLVAGPIGWYVVALDGYGRMIGNAYAVASGREGPLGNDNPAVEQLTVALLPAWQTIALLHCKNVDAVEVTQSPKVAKKYKDRYGLEPVRYNHVKLRLPRQPGAPRGARPEYTGDFLGLHDAAGSFGHYGQCCPPEVHPRNGLLFGRYEGMFWRTPSVRGNPERGMVFSDIEVAGVTAE